jgi:hypothetical protein
VWIQTFEAEPASRPPLVPDVAVKAHLDYGKSRQTTAYVDIESRLRRTIKTLTANLVRNGSS